jgi:GNAT superfamily N-acetyltransferase
MVGHVAVRRGCPADTGVLIELFDEAIAWLVARGQPQQWGSEPLSGSARGRRLGADLAAGGHLWMAELDGEVVGALVLAHEAPEYAPVIDRPEMYIEWLVTRRRDAGRGIGARLIAAAIREARASGCEVLRVDCWAGAPGLVDWYRRQGFVPAGQYQRQGLTGQVFSMSLR